MSRYRFCRLGNQNALVLIVGDWQVLYSYNTPVAATKHRHTVFITKKFYTRTTNRHIKAFQEEHSCTDPKYVLQSWLDDLVEVRISR